MGKIVSFNEYKKNKQDIEDQEYMDFIETLRLLVNIKIPQENKVHVKPIENDYLVLNENLQILKCKFEGSSVTADRKDMLLSHLVNLAPKIIIVHNKDKFENQGVLEIIEDVFGDRVEFSEEVI